MEKTFADFGIDIASGESRTYCPQCSATRTKSYIKCLAVDQVQGVWFCHHCGWAGGLGTGKYEKHDIEKIFKKPHFVSCGIEDEKALEYLSKRGFSKNTLRAFDLSFGKAYMYGKDGKGADENTIQFPYYFNGEVVNVKYRTGDKRFRQEKDAVKCLYNYDMAMVSNSDYLIFTEGECDTLALYEAGYHNAVSVPDGAPTPNTKNYTTKFDFLKNADELISKFKYFVLAVDNDAAGKKLEEELGRRLGLDVCKTVRYPVGCKDANDVLVKYGILELRRVISSAEFFPVNGVKSVDDLYDATMALHLNPHEESGVEIGWNNAIGKFNVEQGQMTIVTGIPSHGKSTFIDALRVNLLKNYGWASAACSPENYPAQNHLAMLIEMYSSMNFYEQTDEDVNMTFDEIQNGFFFIQPEKDDDMVSVQDILDKTKALVFRYGIKVLVIDPWNEIEHKIPVGEREDQYISRQLAKIRRFARVNHIHIFVIVHPKNLAKDKDGRTQPPDAYDIAGGAMWRNKADNILCVYRPDLNTSETYVLVQKVRFRRNGKAGAILKYKFHVGSSTYHDNGC